MNKKKKEALKDFIKHTWGVLYVKYSHLIDEDGWLEVDKKNSEMFDDWTCNFSEDEFRSITMSMGSVDYKNLNLNHPDSRKIRPMSFREFENNNGWIGINHRSEMPKENCLVKICLGGIPDRAIYEWDSNSGLMCAIDGLNVSPGAYKYRFYSANTSHYKIVELDLPPLY